MIDKLLTELFLKPLIHNIWKASKTKISKEPETIPKLSFQKFTIQNYKGIDKVEIDLVKNNLVLLLGLNESGKTTILKGIESFSFLNDPTQDHNPSFYQSIRKKSDVGGNNSAVITAQIRIEEDLIIPKLKKLGETELTYKDIENIESFIFHLNKERLITISRVFPFKSGKPQRYYYQFETDHPFAKNKLSRLLALEIVHICPFIIYFEDFKDRIPENIYVNEKRPDSFDVNWYDIIDGLFYNTDENFSIEQFRKLYSPTTPLLDDAETVETRVNKTLNDTFTKKWKDLSGVQEIEKTELKYYPHRQTPYFTLKVKDKDGTTYSVDERSKGALWYLSFLMKTEFRSKKLRKHFGKPVFLIDEPASNLHSTAQANMIDDFKMLAEDTSIIYTTHSQYLISLENIKNTFVIEKVNGIVNADKWGAYLNRQDAQVSYYQPLANLLNIIPNSIEVPWKECIITEGPSDRHVLLSLFRLINKKPAHFTIYPGTSAHQLAPLITLNIGWNSNFKVLLDSDTDGNKAVVHYRNLFGLKDEIVQLPTTNKKIEKCFTTEEMKAIRDLIFKENNKQKVSKKEFASVWAIISETNKYDSQLKKTLSKETLSLFINLFKALTKRV
jgi:predicted ATP-dependent endonuclease of OLD family